MNSRTILLTLHLISVTEWLGADILQYALTPRLDRESPAVAVAWSRQEYWLHDRYYAVIAVLILATGIGLVIDGDWSWSGWFIWVGIGAIVGGATLGGGGLRSLAKRRVAAYESGDVAGAAAVRRKGFPLQLVVTAIPVVTVLAMVKRWHA